MTKRLFLSMIYALGILAFIGGCAPTTTQHSPTITRVALGTEENEINHSLVREAELALARAQLANPAERDNLLLDIAILFAQAGDIGQSQTTLKFINPDNLNDRFFVEYSLLGLELDLAANRLESATGWLAQARFIAVRKDLGVLFQQRILNLASDLDYARGDIRASIDKSIELAALYTPRRSSDQRLLAQLNDKIWLRISELPFNQLQQTDAGATGVLAGWLELAASIRYRQADPAAQHNLFTVWQKRWRDHPAAKYPPAALKQRPSGREPNNIAVLLPLQGDYAVPSDTLLDGFLSGYYANLAQGRTMPGVAIYDTSARPIKEVYDEAVNRGADLIIGPLRQSQVEQLIAAPLLKVPTLTLNRLDPDAADRLDDNLGGNFVGKRNDSPVRQDDNLIQFGLSALDEINQIADRAWSEGRRNVLLIGPDSGWGVRAQQHFIDYWQAKGGAVISVISYPASVNDFTQLLKSPLEIDLSEQRGVALRRSVKYGLNYTPRRRQDIDLVVALGYAEKVRQIKPSLDFLYAGDIPVYATSHIYGGTQEVELNRDLSGIEFSAMPWTLDGYMPRPLAPDQRLPTAYRQLYALGYDAFLLHALLDQLNRPQAVPVFGATGLLTLSNGVIKRAEKWAQFENGRVVPAQP